MRTSIFFAIPLLLGLTLPVAAQEIDTSKLQAALGGMTPESIAETPIPGLYEIVVQSQIIYLSSNGRYAVQGDIVDLNSTNNLTETARNKLRADAINTVAEEDMIVFPANGESKHTVSVFTDIDCGYCRKLHQEITAYNNKGITVRYLAFPRAGVGSESFNKAVSAWCADDRLKAMTQAKMDQSIEAKTCENPVEAQYELGQRLGVRGTPSIILGNGEMVPGYMPADKLEQTLAAIPKN